MLYSIIFSLVYALIGFLFPGIPQVRIHSSTQSEDIFYARFYINGDIYDKRELYHGDTVYFLIRGEAYKYYEKGIEIDIEDKNYETSSLNLNQAFKTIDIYLDENGKIDKEKTLIKT